MNPQKLIFSVLTFRADAISTMGKKYPITFYTKIPKALCKSAQISLSLFYFLPHTPPKLRKFRSACDPHLSPINPNSPLCATQQWKSRKSRKPKCPSCISQSHTRANTFALTFPLAPFAWLGKCWWGLETASVWNFEFQWALRGIKGKYRRTDYRLEKA